MKSKRQSLIYKLIILIYICLSIFGLVACKDAIPPISKIEVHKDFSVNFLDVGQGDCIFIRLPDGKNMLIDCGVNDKHQENFKYVKSYLNQYNVKKIDYFVLTHPDLDHMGNAISLINAFSIGTMYIPQIHQSQMQNFQHFSTLLEVVDQKQINYQISIFPTTIFGLDYHFAFLSPQNDQRNSYDKLPTSNVPTGSDVNNLSPIIYFNCFGKRFIFTGDAEKQEERYVLDNFFSGVYDLYYGDLNIDLKDIDYLKLSHHGSEDASCEEFLTLLKPKNVIISVGNDNYYAHPSSETLIRIENICKTYNLYRTDSQGSICIYKGEQDFIVKTAKNN